MADFNKKESLYSWYNRSLWVCTGLCTPTRKTRHYLIHMSLPEYNVSCIYREEIDGSVEGKSWEDL